MGKNKGMIEFENSFFKRIINKIKNLFCVKNKVSDNDLRNENIQSANLNNTSENTINENNSNFDQSIIDLHKKFEENLISEDMMSEVEKKELKKYYIYLINDVDLQIKNTQQEISKRSQELINLYKKGINMKEQ
ncbi:MAG: hypothetical protein IJX99_04735 [Clostridia bacterium]|nr:hypothetical protein [Clostridia bacterium]